MSLLRGWSLGAMALIVFLKTRSSLLNVKGSRRSDIA
jgi:hypothetical protein